MDCEVLIQFGLLAVVHGPHSKHSVRGHRDPEASSGWGRDALIGPAIDNQCALSVKGSVVSDKAGQ
jgi:hypothetical protein